MGVSLIHQFPSIKILVVEGSGYIQSTNKKSVKIGCVPSKFQLEDITSTIESMTIFQRKTSKFKILTFHEVLVGLCHDPKHFLIYMGNIT